MLRLHISQAWCHKPVIPVVRGLRKKDQKFKASLAISSTLVSKRKVDAVGAHITLSLIPSPTIFPGCYVLIIVYLRWRQELRDLRSSLTLYGVQGHHGYTKQSQSRSMSNACVGSKELCFSLVAMLICGAGSKGARWAVLLCGRVLGTF